MFDKEAVEKILIGVAELNTRMGVFAWLIPLILVVLVLFLLWRAYQRPGKEKSRWVMGFLAIVYVFGGWTIYVGKDVMGTQMALTGAIALWMVALILLLDAVFAWTIVSLSERKDLKIVALFLMFSGIFLYPLLEVALGFAWPGMVLFGAECPTTIFLIGLLIGSIPKTNRWLLILVSINAIFTGASVAVNGAPFDYLYAFAGVCGIYALVKYRKIIFTRERKDDK